ncbi:hypothetical protein C8A05DRAFT_36758 [Staphylotrichum tortipilum]|uniref:Uncharacterized protein n=1 Tax=Staphylotrichum tortipilum TaxID=2831512 RepID=A0AAN6MFL3_9PEZI|nr:hypothetical protein C8A05DRAFT_36758 [Staphylotrichum longicolle]
MANNDGLADNLDQALLEMNNGPELLLNYINEHGGVGDIENAPAFDFGLMVDDGNAGDFAATDPGLENLNFDALINYNNGNNADASNGLNAVNGFTPINGPNAGAVGFLSPSAAFQGLPAADDDDAASGSSISATFRQAMSGLAVNPAAAVNPAQGAGLAMPQAQFNLPRLPELNLPQVPQLNLPQVPQVPVPQVPQQASPALVPKLHHKRKGKMDANNDPRAVYTAPQPVPSWGPMVAEGYAQEPLFKYFRNTPEWIAGRNLTKEQIVTFLKGDDHPNGNQRRLTVWIQSTPAQSNDRYAGGPNAAKCRFKDCPGVSNSILKGFYRVAFDEFSNLTGTAYDPMQNAGYLHLHCFETMFDLGFLVHYSNIHGFQVVADTRNFARETKNPASIERDHIEMSQAFREWVEDQRQRATTIMNQNLAKPQDQWYTGFAPAADAPHDQRLGCCLTDKHISLEARARAQTRAKRGGAHIGLHRGDLEKWLQLRRQNTLGKQKGARAQAVSDDADAEGEDDTGEDNACEGPSNPRPASKPPNNNSKRKRGGNADEEEEEEEEDAGGATTRPAHPSRRSKRARNDKGKGVGKGKGIATGSPSTSEKSQGASVDADGDTRIADADAVQDTIVVGGDDDDMEDDIYGASPRAANPPSPTYSLSPPSHRSPTGGLPRAPPGPSTRANPRKRSRDESDPGDSQEETQTVAPALRATRTRAAATPAPAQQQQEQTPSPQPKQQQPLFPPFPQPRGPNLRPPGPHPLHHRSAVGLPAEFLAWANGIVDFVVPRHGTLHNDWMARRIGALDRRQRFDVEAAVAREENRARVMGAKKRKVVSF